MAGEILYPIRSSFTDTHRLPGALGMVWDLWKTNDMGHGGICMGNSNLTFSIHIWGTADSIWGTAGMFGER